MRVLLVLALLALVARAVDPSMWHDDDDDDDDDDDVDYVDYDDDDDDYDNDHDDDDSRELGVVWRRVPETRGNKWPSVGGGHHLRSYHHRQPYHGGRRPWEQQQQRQYHQRRGFRDAMRSENHRGESRRKGYNRGGRAPPRRHDPVAASAWRHRLSGAHNLFSSMMRRLNGLRQGELTLGPVHLDWDLGRMGAGGDAPWYEGPNVCESRDENDEEHVGDIQRHQFTTSTTCDETDTLYKCTVSMDVYGKRKTVTVSYQCCYGYERIAGEPGCPRELSLTDLPSTARQLNLDGLLEAIHSVKLNKALAENNFTVFAPTDKALGVFKPTDMPEANVVLVSAELLGVASELQAVLGSHLVPGFLPTAQLRDEQILKSFYPRASIRINVYNSPVKLTTANCVAVTSADHLATNGVIHVVERVLPSVTHSIIGLVSSDPELSTLKTVLGRTGLVGQLKADGQYTLFAPTNAAFAQLSDDLRNSLMQQTDTCLSKTIMAHLLNNVICSSVIQGQGRTYNLLGGLLHLNRSAEGKVFVEGGQVVRADIMATNGVVHIIDRVIIPRQALNIVKIAEQAGATEALALMTKAGLIKTLRSMENMTVFLPTNQAIQSLPADVRAQLSENPELLEQVLQHHIVATELREADLYNDQRIDTSHGSLVVKEYSSFPFSTESAKTIQCARIVRADLESCNAVAHIINKVLLPPAGDVLDVMSQHSRFSRFVALMKEAGVAEKLQLSGPFTVFAPTDKAFTGVEEVLLTDLRRDKNKLAGFIAHHITHDTLCCSGMSLGMRWMWKPREMTLDPGSHVVLERRRGVLRVDGVMITTCDMTATNGVVHAIDHFLPSAAAKFGLLPREARRLPSNWVTSFFDHSWRDIFEA